MTFHKLHSCLGSCWAIFVRVQLPPISLRSKYPQQVVPVGGRRVGRAGVAPSGEYDDDDDDIEDDFNWDSLIAKDNNELTCAV